MSLFKRLLAAQGFLLVTSWAGYVVLYCGIVVTVAAVGTVGGSIWEGASQLPRWFALAIGIYLTGTYLRLAVAHGLTRREFMIQTSAFIVVYATMFSALLTIGFALERLLYRLGGWPQDLHEASMFDSPTQLGLIFVAFWLVAAVWIAAGTLLAAAFYRNGLLGALTIPMALLLVSSTELAVGFNPTPFLRNVLGFTDAPAPALLVVALCATSFALGLALTWAVVRNTPIRPKTT
jgi:hypothetical protein